MTAGLMVFPGAQPSRNRNGGAVYAELRFYVNNTTTPKTVYADEALTVPLSFPVVSDDAGRFSAIWADTAELYTVNWSTADGQDLTLDDLSASLAADAMILDETDAALAYIQGLVAGYAGTVLYDFSTTTTDADPGPGLLRFNDSTVGSVTEIYADNLDANGVDATAYLDSFSDANASSNRGTLTVRSLLDSSKFAVFYVSGDVVNSTGYRTIPVTWIDGDARPADLTSISVSFAAAGPIGVTGDPGTNGWSPIFAVVNDGVRRVEQVTSWTGGTGTPPASPVYVGASGFTTNIALAVDIRGPSGAGTGDMLYSENLAYMGNNATSRTNLGLGSAAVLNTGTAVNNVIQWAGTSTYPAGDASNLTNVPPSTWTLNTQAGAYAILAADKGKALTYTGSGAVTWTVTAAATLGGGWWASINNEGTGIVTLDPNGSETVNGLASILIYPGETFFLRSDGTNLFTVGRANRVLVQTSALTGLTSITADQAFTDPESVSVDLDFTGCTAASGQITAQFKYAGSYASTGHSYYYLGVAPFSATNASSFPLNVSGWTGYTTRIQVTNPRGVAGAMAAFWECSPTGGALDAMRGNAYNTTASANQGFQASVGSAWTAGTLRAYINRS